MIYQFQFLRFIGAISVVLFHTAGPLAFFGDIPVLFRDGPAWVCFFFSLSGFFSYLSATKTNTLNAKSFYLDKARRLYPIYAVGLAVICIYADIKSDVLLSVFLLQSWVPQSALSYNGAAWYMSNLLFFYLLFPLFFACYQKWQKAMVAFSLAALLYSYYIYTIFYDDMFIAEHKNTILHAVVQYCPLMNLPSFLIGISMAAVIDSFKKRAVYSYLTCLYSIALVLLFDKPLIPLYGVISGLFFAPLIIFIFLDNGWLPKLLKKFSWPLNVMGDMSYPIYIMHIPVAIFIINRFAVYSFTTNTYLQTLLATLVVAYLLSVMQRVVFDRKARTAIAAELPQVSK